jgi:hypothetical protein
MRGMGAARLGPYLYGSRQGVRTGQRRAGGRRSVGRLAYGEWRRRDPLTGLNEDEEARGAVRVEAVDSMPLVAGRTWVRLVATAKGKMPDENPN